MQSYIIRHNLSIYVTTFWRITVTSIDSFKTLRQLNVNGTQLRLFQFACLRSSWLKTFHAFRIR